MPLQLKHIALVSSTAEKADRFYKDVLGLQKIDQKTIPATLSNEIFNVNAELNFDGNLFEIKNLS